MSVYTDNANLMLGMGITENQFKNAVNNNRSKIVELISTENSAELDKSKGVGVLMDIINNVGVLNSGGYDNIAREHQVPPKHVIDLYEEFKATVLAMHANGDLD